MNKKGFTLVELLAVIVIIALLALITSTSVTKLVSDSKGKLSSTQINLIKSAAETWGADNIDKLPDENECAYITLKDLNNQALINSNIIDPKNNDQISPDLKIKISNTLSEYGKEIITYEVNPKDIGGCKWVYPCKYTMDSDGNEMVTCGTESFYVMDKTTSEITMLAQYNITLSTTNPLQDSSDTTLPAKNPTAFSQEQYWTNGGYSPAGNSEYLYVYNSNSNLYQYVEAYRHVLVGTGVTVKDAKLMSYEQANALGCYSSNRSCKSAPSSAPSWIYSSTYWLGSASDINGMWLIGSDGVFSTGFSHNRIGIRPVITIPINDIG